ncbi:GntR family transcriptional regulator [Gordonia polyisoprenivorans]|uniref:GntR family transcriptional regulator n=1 Tax=Gordonia polyisoprenivorans TaxID=84595 RepID=UPI0003699C5B|nr:GntR family transcriptional regulator [Gordonia polyisoprenivorans]
MSASSQIADRPARLDLTIDRAAPIPIHHQLAHQIESAISRGELASGDQLETEIELSRRLDIGRVTVRRALRDLAALGIVVRRRGVGTYVTQARDESRFASITEFDKDELDAEIRSGEIRSGTVVLDYHRVTCALDAPEDFPLAVRGGLIEIRRLHTARGRPHSLMAHWVPAVICPPPADLERRGLREALRSRGVHPCLVRERIAARAASDSEAAHLDITAGSPLLCVRRTSIDRSGRVVMVGESVYSPDAYAYHVSVV